MQATPRWEYRCWTDRAHARSLFAGDWQARPVEHRQDMYLIGPDEALLPKLRDGAKLEIKRLLKTRDRMELWGACLSVPLPRARDISGQLAAAGMGLFKGATLPADYVSIAAGAEQWFAAPVDKSRRLFLLEGLRCEITRVLFADKEYWTFAAESAEYSPLAQLLEKLPIGKLPNRNYRNFLVDSRRTEG